MGKVKELTGFTFGELTVLERDQTVPSLKDRSMWSCLCSCGTLKSIRSTDLISGKTKTCGNKTIHDSRKQTFLWKGYGEISLSLWGRTKSNASYRKIDFTISIEEAWELFLAQEGKCALSGVLLTFSSTARSKDGTASLDRIDSTKSYTVNNVQWVHKTVNKMKMNLPNEEFITWCKS